MMYSNMMWYDLISARSAYLQYDFKVVTPAHRLTAVILEILPFPYLLPASLYFIYLLQDVYKLIHDSCNNLWGFNVNP